MALLQQTVEADMDIVESIYFIIIIVVVVDLVRITETARATIRCLAVRSIYMQMCNDVYLSY